MVRVVRRGDEARRRRLVGGHHGRPRPTASGHIAGDHDLTVTEPSDSTLLYLPQSSIFLGLELSQSQVGFDNKSLESRAKMCLEF